MTDWDVRAGGPEATLNRPALPRWGTSLIVCYGGSAAEGLGQDYSADSSFARGGLTGYGSYGSKDLHFGCYTMVQIASGATKASLKFRARDNGGRDPAETIVLDVFDLSYSWRQHLNASLTVPILEEAPSSSASGACDTCSTGGDMGTVELGTWASTVSAQARTVEGEAAALTLTLDGRRRPGRWGRVHGDGRLRLGGATVDDLGTVPSRVRVPEGSRTVDFGVPTMDDAYDGDEETFTVTVSPIAANMQVAEQGSGVGWPTKQPPSGRFAIRYTLAHLSGLEPPVAGPSLWQPLLTNGCKKIPAFLAYESISQS